MRVGYARTSTVEQVAGFETQIEELKAAGCEELYTEQVSAVKERDQLELALRYVRKGDCLVVTKLDRLARSMSDLVRITSLLDQKGVDLCVLNINLDTATPTGRFMLNMIGAVAEFERSMMLERQKDGIAAAKEKGKYKGRKPTARAKAADVHDLHAQGLKKTEIAEKLGIGVASVYRALASTEKAA